MADAFTGNYNLAKVEVGASRDTWGGKLNDNADKIDAALNTLAKQIASVGANSAGPTPQGRLTFQSGAPVMFADVNSAITLYYSPYGGNSVPTWNGFNFIANAFSELSQDISDKTYSPDVAQPNAMYDAFVWMDKVNAADVKADATKTLGDPILRLSRGFPWNSLQSRGAGAGTSELVRTGPYLVNKYAITNGPGVGYGLYVGSFYVSQTGRLDFSQGGGNPGGAPVKLHCYNYYNRINYVVKCSDTSGSHVSPSVGVIRPYNGSLGNSISVVCGAQEDGWDLLCKVHVQNGGQSTVTLPNFGFGVNQFNTLDYQNNDNDGTPKYNWLRSFNTQLPPSLGRTIFYMLESMNPSGVTWLDNAKDHAFSGRFVM
jgi:hypothetical protein